MKLANLTHSSCLPNMIVQLRPFPSLKLQYTSFCTCVRAHATRDKERLATTDGRGRKREETREVTYDKVELGRDVDAAHLLLLVVVEIELELVRLHIAQHGRSYLAQRAVLLLGVVAVEEGGARP
jgi:hypothetical protein